MLAEDANVVELMDPSTKWWNMSLNLIKEVFKEDEAKIICKIHLSRCRQQDVVLWRDTS